MAAVPLNGKIYAIGGGGDLFDPFDPFVNTVEVYDPPSNTWSAGAFVVRFDLPLFQLYAPVPTVRKGMAAAALNGKIYAIGGTDSVGVGLNTVDVYDPVINAWSAAASMLTARSFLAATPVNGKIYAIGGFTISGATNLVEVFDPAANNGAGGWSSVRPMQSARELLAAVPLNGKIYAIGGDPGKGRVTEALKFVDVYDPATTFWNAAAPMSIGRTGLAATEANGLIYAVGGEQTSGGSTGSVEAYSPPVTIFTFIKN